MPPTAPLPVSEPAEVHVPERPDRRRLIVDAALEVIGEAGLGGFTQPRVAARVDMRQSHLTYYFPTRDDLLVAVAEEAVRRRVAVLTDALADAAGAEEHRRALARVLASPEQTRILLALTQAADQNPALRASFDALAAGAASLGSRVLTAAGVPVDPARLALLQATSTGVAVLSLARGGDPSSAEHILGVLLDHLATAPGGTA